MFSAQPRWSVRHVGRGPRVTFVIAGECCGVLRWQWERPGGTAGVDDWMGRASRQAGHELPMAMGLGRAFVTCGMRVCVCVRREMCELPQSVVFVRSFAFSLLSNANACLVFVGGMLACVRLAGRCGFGDPEDFTVHVGQRRQCAARIVCRG